MSNPTDTERDAGPAGQPAWPAVTPDSGDALIDQHLSTLGLISGEDLDAHSARYEAIHDALRAELDDES